MIRFECSAFSKRLMFLLPACVLLALPARAPASWDNAASDPGRTSHDNSRGEVVLPISVRGLYEVGEFPDIMATALVDRQHIYLVSAFKVVAMKRIEGTDTDVTFDKSTILWEYEVEPFGGGLNMRRIGSPGMFTPASMAALAGGRVVFVEEETNFFDLTDNKTWIVALDRWSGEEVWRYELDTAFGAAMNAVQNTLYVRYEIPDDDFDFTWPRNGHTLTGRLMRIAVGAEAPEAEVEIDFAADNPDIVLGTHVLFLLEDDRVSAFSRQTLARQWTYPQAPLTLEALHGGGFVQNMVVTAGTLFLTVGDTKVLALGPGGALVWERDLDEGGCWGVLRLSKHPDVLVVSGLCDNEQDNSQMVGLDPATGETLWHIDTPDQINIYPPVISGNAAYKTVRSEDFMNPGLLHAYDVYTGELLQEATGFLQGVGIVVPLAAADGYLYGATIGVLGSGEGRVVPYETTPANLAVTIRGEDRFPCGVPSGFKIPISLDITNLGPGVATDAVLRINALNVPVGWEFAGEQTHQAFDTSIRIELGDVDVFGHVPINLHVTPEHSGELLLEASLTMSVRNIDPDDGRAGTSFQVGPPAHPELDLLIDWVEITQGIQDADNSIGLIAGKPTLIRVYPRSNVPVENVNARLRVTGGSGVDSFERMVAPLQQCLTLPTGSADRRDIGSSFNFLIPPDLISSKTNTSLNVEIVLDPDNLFQEQNRANNVYTASLDFDELPPMCVKTYRVRHLAMGGGDTRGPSRIPDSHIERMESLLPTREILQFPTGQVLEKMGFFEWVPYELDPGGSQNTGRILATLWAHRITSSDPLVCKARGAITMHMGLVAENNLSTQANANFNGIAARPGYTQVNRVRETEGSGVNFPAGGVTMAHEIGHNFNRRHVNCGDPDGPDPNYPYHACQMGPVSDAAFFGVDLMDPRNPVVIPPRPPDADNRLSDLLSYAGTRWTSDYTWNAMRSYMIANQKLQEARKTDTPPETDGLYRQWLAEARQFDEKTILFTASVEADGSTEIEFILPVSPTVIPDEKALELVARNFSSRQDDDAYAIELVDGVGNVIETIHAVPEVTEDAGEPGWIVGALLPSDADLQAIRIRDTDGEIVGERERSPSAPEVTLTAPTSGTTVEDFLIVEWDASDADGDQLLTMVQYSNDDGETWVTLVTDAPESPQVFEADLIPGTPGTARIRVIVSDGFNAVEAISEAFTVTPSAPTVSISRPADGESFTAGEPVFLRGSAYDPEDGPLLDQALVWEVVGIGEVGVGRSLILGELEPGSYSIILTATDSDGDSSSDAVSITIDNREASRGQITGVLLGVLQAVGETIFDLNQDDTIDSADIIHAEE